MICHLGALTSADRSWPLPLAALAAVSGVVLVAAFVAPRPWKTFTPVTTVEQLVFGGVDTHADPARDDTEKSVGAGVFYPDLYQ